MTIQHVDSTNSFLKNLLSNSKPVPEGTVIMAESQYAGRGQQSNRWHSEPGKNLTFSIYLKPAFLPVPQQFDLTRAISLGVVNALTPILGEKFKIKWPNDLYYENGKLGGILIENLLQGTQIKSSVIGIGLNINQEAFPPGAANAMSVKQILHRDYDLKFLLSEICKNIEAEYLKLKAGQFDHLRNSYLGRLYWLNEEHNFRAKPSFRGTEMMTTFKGVIKGVKENGLLIVNTGQEDMEFSFKEIEFLNK